MPQRAVPTTRVQRRAQRSTPCGLALEIGERLDRRRRELADFDDVSIGIADVASRLVIMIIERLAQKFRAFGLPTPITSPNIRHPQIQERTQAVRIGRRLENHFGLVRRGSAADIYY